MTNKWELLEGGEALVIVYNLMQNAWIPVVMIEIKILSTFYTEEKCLY